MKFKDTYQENGGSKHLLWPVVQYITDIII